MQWLGSALCIGRRAEGYSYWTVRDRWRSKRYLWKALCVYLFIDWPLYLLVYSFISMFSYSLFSCFIVCLYFTLWYVFADPYVCSVFVYVCLYLSLYINFLIYLFITLMHLLYISSFINISIFFHYNSTHTHFSLFIPLLIDSSINLPLRTLPNTHTHNTTHIHSSSHPLLVLILR